MSSRREALKIIGAVGVTCAFPFPANELYGQAAQAATHHAQANAEEPVLPQFFTSAQLLVIARLTDLIIPATDTPGAASAGVPQYIDLVVNDAPDLQMVFQEGLRRLQLAARSTSSKDDFLQLTEAQQVQILTSFSESKLQEEALFFQSLKNLTADGYYTSRVGLLDELGYNGDTYLAAFPQFTIPEH